MGGIGSFVSALSAFPIDVSDFGAPDDPELWKTQPMTLQIVGRPYRDEALIANCELLDEIVNGKRE